MSRTSSDAGYTLLEALIVVAILGVVAAAVSGIGGNIPAEHRSGIRDVISNLRAARAKAMATQLPTEVVFDLDQMRYGIGTADRPLAFETAGFLVSRPALAYASNPGTSVWFYADGSASGGALTLTSRSQSSVIHVHWITGEIRHD